VGYFQYLFFYWLHYYFDSVVQVEKTTARLYAGLPNLAMAACMPLGGWWADRMRRRHGPGRARWVPGASMGAAAVLLLVALTAESAGRATVWFTASLGVLGLAEASFWGVVVRMGGPRGGLAASIMNMGGNGIGLLAPMLTPWIGRWLGWKWGIGAGAAVAILGALCWVGVRPKDAGQGGIRPCSPAPPR
jgi:MFS family permease